MNDQAGWHHVAVRDRHYFRAGRSLCGEYSLFPGAVYYLDESDEQTPDDCPECRRLLREERTHEPIQA